MRKLVCEFASIFRIFQYNMQTKEDMDIADILYTSISYRRVIEDACASLLKDLGDPVELEMLQNCDAIWYFCELCLLSEDDGRLIAPAIVTWLNYLPKFEYPFDSSLFSNPVSYPNPETLPDYWNILYHYAIYGNYEVVQCLITVDSRYQDFLRHQAGEVRRTESEIQKLFKNIDQILHSVPNPSDSFYLENFRSWQEAISSVLLSSKCLDKNLRVVFEILAGDAKTIKAHCQNWKEFLSAQITYCYPECTLSDLETIFKKLTTSWPECRDDKSFQLHANIVQRNIRKIILGVGEIGSWWMLSHLSDLFYHAHIMGDHLEFEQKRELFIYQHAMTLLNQDLNTLVPAYLVFGCPKNGKDILKKILRSTPIASEKHACQMLTTCAQYKLDREIAVALKTTMAHQLRQKKQYTAALRWFIDANDIPMAANVSSLLLDAVVKRVESCDVPLLQMISSEIQSRKAIDVSSFVSDIYETSEDSLQQNLHFLVIFHQIASSYQDGQYDAVQSGIVAALSGAAPQRFWVTLLLDAKMMIEEKGVVFGVNETTALMKALEQLSFSLHKEYFPENWSSIEQNLRCIFVRNFSQSLMNNTIQGGTNAVELCI